MKTNELETTADKLSLADPLRPPTDATEPLPDLLLLDLLSERSVSPESLPPCVIALGNFDGVHVAHRALLGETIRLADTQSRGSDNGETVYPAVFFFDPPSGDFLFTPPPGHLTTREEKLSILKSVGIRFAMIAQFPKFRNQPADEFVAVTLRRQCHAAGVVCGYNFRFGFRGSGTAASLEKEMAPLPVRCLSNVYLPGHTNTDGTPFEVSSSRIRQILPSANLDLVREMLGEPFRMTGTVVHGKQLGRTIGLPTINQNVPEHKLLPPDGIYATRCQIGDVLYNGVTNIGTRPTTDICGMPRRNVETHLLHTQGNFYGQTATVFFYRFLRGEKAFPSLDDLRRAIEADAEHAAAVLENEPPILPPS